MGLTKKVRLLVVWSCFLVLTASTLSAQHRAPTPKSKRFAPPVFGHWRVGEALVMDGGKAYPITLADSLHSGITLLPADLRVDFKTGYDATAREPVSTMVLQPPFPQTACQLQSTRYHCEAQHPSQEAITWEFVLEVSRDQVYETFGGVGASAKDVSYTVHGNGHQWDGEFFASKDKQTMWTPVFPGEAYFTNAAGIKKEVAKTATVLQVYHRVTK